MSHYSSGGADCDGIVRDVLSDYGSCSDQCVLADRHARDDRGASADRRVTLHTGLEKLPFSMRSGVFVIGERDVRRDEDVVFDDYSRWDEDEGSNLAVVSNCNALFDVYVGVDLGVLSDLAPVEVYLVVDS